MLVKKIILISILLSQTIWAQNWNYKSGGNVFDGKYRTASIIGKGNDFPYNKPILVLNLFNEESLNFYITNSGYFPDTSSVEILWVFDNEPNTIYKSVEISKSKDNETLFLKSFINTITKEEVNQIEFIEKLKKALKINVRISDYNSQNDLIFSSKGSTKAINYVFSKKNIQNLITKEKKTNNQHIESKEEKGKVKEKTLQLFKKAGITNEKKLQELYIEVNKAFDWDIIKIKEVDSISLEVKKNSTNLLLLNNRGIKLKNINNVTQIIPDFVSNHINKKKLLEYNKALKKATLLLKDYSLNKNELKVVAKEIVFVSETYNIEIDKIKKLKINIPSKGFASLKLYYLNNKFITEKDIDIPHYLKKTQEEIQKKAIKRIKILLDKYKITDLEKDRLLKTISKEDLHTIELKELDSVNFEFLSYATKIKFSKNERDVIIVPIFDKKLSRSIKKKVK
ncbi:hypothetical protein [Tenacibaculum mesophilum]|uniref:hypothetical protein n=1 Tax=Tenacibaculum mesophilum TaxID=104268 RepID=UPI00064A1351|nr:hypothetical protein [Tenacibaculum mesophilum]